MPMSMDPEAFNEWENDVTVTSELYDLFEAFQEKVHEAADAKIEEAFRQGCAVVLDEVKKDCDIGIAPDGKLDFDAFLFEKYAFSHTFDFDEVLCTNAEIYGLDQPIAWLEKRIAILKSKFE